MIANKKEFGIGLGMLACFWIVFSIGVSPIFGNMNILDYMDNLYNSISKYSANYFPFVKERGDAFNGRQVAFAIPVGDESSASSTAAVFEAGGGMTSFTGEKLRVRGDLGAMLNAVIDDAEAMFNNNGKVVALKYAVDEKKMLYLQWLAMKEVERDLKRQKLFDEAKAVNHVISRAIEPAYNYYGIEAEPISTKLVIVICSLIGYVVYTLWFGFSILYLFEGWGMKMSH